MSEFNDLLKLISEERKKKKLMAESELSDFLTLVEEAKPVKQTQEQPHAQQEFEEELVEEKEVEPVLISKEETENVLSEIFGQIKKEKEFQSKLKEVKFDDFFAIVEKVYGPPKPEVEPEVQPLELEKEQLASDEFIENPDLLGNEKEMIEPKIEIEEVHKVEYAEKQYVELLVEDLAKRQEFETIQSEIKLLKKLYEDFKKTIIKDISKLGNKVSPGALYNSSGGGAVNLKDLEDVNAKNLIDGYVLTYNQTLNKFVFAPSTNLQKIAAEPIFANTAVIVSGDLVYNASSLDQNSIGIIAGIASTDADLGDPVEVKYNIEVNNPSWNFSPTAKTAFLGTDGTVQETVEPNSLVVQVIGRILSPTKIYVENGFAALRTL